MKDRAYRGVQFYVSYPDSLEGLALLARGQDRAFADWLIGRMVEGASYDSWTGKPGPPMDRAGAYWTNDRSAAWSYAGSPGQADYGPDAGNITIPVVMTAEWELDENHRNPVWDASDMNNPYDEGAQWKEDALGIEYTPSGFYHLPEGTPLTITSFEVITPTKESAQALLDAFGKDVEGGWGSLGPADWYTSEYRTWRLPIPTMQTTAFSKKAGRSGDGWIECSDGEERWGIFGSAGVLFFYDEGGERRYFLQHRSPGVDSGGTWGIPGGALDEGETPEMGALREFAEEVGFVPSHRVVQVYEDKVADDWSYTTIVAQVGEPFGHEGSTWEADTGGWFTLNEMVGLNLHPGFASSLGRIT